MVDVYTIGTASGPRLGRESRVGEISGFGNIPVESLTGQKFYLSLSSWYRKARGSVPNVGVDQWKAEYK